MSENERLMDLFTGLAAGVALSTAWNLALRDNNFNQGLRNLYDCNNGFHDSTIDYQIHEGQSIALPLSQSYLELNTDGKLNIRSAGSNPVALDPGNSITYQDGNLDLDVTAEELNTGEATAQLEITCR